MKLTIIDQTGAEEPTIEIGLGITLERQAVLVKHLEDTLSFVCEKEHDLSVSALLARLAEVADTTEEVVWLALQCGVELYRMQTPNLSSMFSNMFEKNDFEDIEEAEITSEQVEG